MRAEKEAMQEQLRQSFEREAELKHALRQSMDYLNLVRSAMTVEGDHDAAHRANALIQECEVLL